MAGSLLSQGWEACLLGDCGSVGRIPGVGITSESLSLSRDAAFEDVEVEVEVLLVVPLLPLKGDQAPFSPLVVVLLREFVFCHVVIGGFLQLCQ